MSETSESDLPLLDDPSPLEIEEIRQLAEEWQTVHMAMQHDGEEPSFVFQRNVYDDDDTEDVLVVCQLCGDCEMVAFSEIDEEEGERFWFPMFREEPN